MNFEDTAKDNGEEKRPADEPPAQSLRAAIKARNARAHFLLLAVLAEGALVVVALLVGWIFHVDVLSGLRPSVAAVLVGLVGAVPPFVLLVATEPLRIPALERIKDLVLETLGPSLTSCRWFEVILLAAVAGVGEEILFRGAVQPLFERWTMPSGWSRAGGLIASNVIFGLLHFITPTYAVLAGLMGVYFGLLLDAAGPRNLLAPIVAHGLYDYLAFLVLIRAARRRPVKLPSTPEG